MSGGKPARSDPDSTFPRENPRSGAVRLRGHQPASATWPSARSPSPDEPASPAPAAARSTAGRLRRLRHLTSHREIGQSVTTPEPFPENHDGFANELVEIKPSQRDRE